MLLNTTPTLVLCIVLFIAPLLGAIFTCAFTKLAKKEIPPLMPQLNSYSFGQAIIIIVAAFSTERLSPGVGLATFFVFLTLVFLLLGQAWIDQAKKEKTDDYTSEIIDEKVRPHLKPGIEIDKVKNIAYSLIEEDFFPKSWTQKRSGYRRQRRREQFAELINDDFCSGLPQPLSQKDFLVSDDRTKTLRALYLFVNSLSFIFYLGSVTLLILVVS